MGDMIIPIAIGVVVVLIVVVLILMALTKKKNTKVNPSVSATLNRQPNFDRTDALEEPKVNVMAEQVVVVKENKPVQEPVKRETIGNTPEVRTVVDEAENVLDDIQNIIGDHQVTTPNDNLDEKGRPKRIVENTKIEVDPTKDKEDVILKLKTASNKKTPYKVKPPVVKDTPGEKAEVTINEAMDEPDEPKYDKIPEYVDPKTIKENGVDAEVTEGKALQESKASEIDVFDDTHKEENKPLTNEEGEYVEEVKSTPLHEEYEYDPEDDEIEEQKTETTPEVSDDYSKTEMLDVDEINRELEKQRRIRQITEEEINKYIQEMQDSLIDEAELYIEEMKSKVR